MRASLTAPAWAILEYFSYPILVFVSTPWFLQHLGVQRYGYWMMLNAVVGLGGFLATGTGMATTQHVAAGRGRRDVHGVERTVRAALALALAGGLFACVAMAATYFAAWELLARRMSDPAELAPLMLAAALLVALEQIDGVFASSFRGAEQFALAARIEVACKTAQILAALLTVLMSDRIAVLYATLVGVAVVRAGVKGWLVQRTLAPRLLPARDGVAVLIRDARWGWVQGLGGLLFGVADRLLIGAVLGSTRLGWYSIAAQLPQQIHAVCAAGMSVILPRVGRASQDADPAAPLRRLALRAAAVNVAASSVMAVPLLLLGPAILSTWLGPAVAEACAHIMSVLTLAYWLLAVNVAPHFMLLGLGRMRFVALSNLVAGAALLIALVELLPVLGLVGAGVARIVYGAVLLVNVVPLVTLLRDPSSWPGSKPSA